MVKKIAYPTAVIDYVIDDIAQLSSNRIKGKKEIKLYYGSQINAHPHLGNIVSAMCTYALAKHMTEYFGLPSKVFFTALENEGGVVKKVDDIKYSRMLCDHQPGGAEDYQRYLQSFNDMFSALSDISSVPTEMNFYTDLQGKKLARKTLLEMIERTEELLPLLNPKRDKIGVRFKCPECKFIDKHYKTQELLDYIPGKKAVFRNKCFEHGYHTHTVTPDNNEFFDVNSMVRNVLKEIVISEEAEQQSDYPVIVKGSDWVPTAIMVSEALEAMGYSNKKRPQRIFTPLVLDWSGAKISKSEKDDQEYLPTQFLSYPDFNSYYGKEGLEILWKEVLSWMTDTQKFFRHYTAEYFEKILAKNKKRGFNHDL